MLHESQRCDLYSENTIKSSKIRVWSWPIHRKWLMGIFYWWYRWDRWKCFLCYKCKSVWWFLHTSTFTDQKQIAERGLWRRPSWTRCWCASCRRSTGCPRRLRSWWCEPTAGRTCCWAKPSTGGKAPGTHDDLEASRKMFVRQCVCECESLSKDRRKVRIWLNKEK